MMLNVAVVNNSGNVGKSTICETLLKPRFKKAEVVKVETINSDGSDDVKYSADEFDEILKQIDATDCSIIDVGSSNIENFILKMKEYKDSHEDIDYFIIPIIPKNKQQVDSVATAGMLIDMGIEPERIRFIFNQADRKLPIDRQYKEFLSGIEMFDIKVENYSVIYETTVFHMLDKTFTEVVNDKRNFRKLLRAEKSRAKKEEISEMKSVKRLVSGVNDDLDIAFKMLNLDLGVEEIADE